MYCFKTFEILIRLSSRFNGFLMSAASYGIAKP